MADLGSLPAVDARRLAELGAVGGPELLDEVVEVFRRDLPDRLSALRDGLERGDRLEVERTAHSLRGSAGQLGLSRAQALAAEIERTAAADGLESLGALGRAVEAELDLALGVLRQRVRAGPSTEDVSEPARKAAHVLVVDDDAHIARFVEYVLVGAGYVVTAVTSGRAALEACGRFTPDAIVLDIVMPGMSGFDVLARLRATPAASSPVVVLTARAANDTAGEAMAAGASAYCEKPVAPTTLLERLAALGIGPSRRDGGPSSLPPRFAGAIDQGLLSEVAAGWEALGALHDLTTAESASGVEGLRRRVVERLCRVQSGLCAELWVAGAEPCGLGAVDPSSGIIGLAEGRRDGILLDTAELIAAVSGLEPALRGARSALAVPFRTGSDLRGALVAWRSDDAPLDTRLVRLAESLAGQVSALLENARLLNAQRERERLEQEVAIGGRIQRTLLLSEPPRGLDGLECAALWLPSHAVGGDFFEFLSLPAGGLDVVLGDVMGKGVPAALLGAAAKGHVLRAFGGPGDTGPDAIVQRVHERMFDELVALESFITLCYARFEPLAGRLLLVDAGHTRTLRVRNGVARALSGTNRPLGFLARERFVARAFAVRPGDVFLLYSDGVTDARDRDGEALGEERLAKWLEDHAGLAPGELTAALEEELRTRAGDSDPGDDVTAVCVRVGADPRPALALDATGLAAATVRGWVDSALKTLSGRRLDEGGRAALVLAVHEAVGNVLEHGYRGQPGPIEIRADVKGDALRVRIAYDGAPFRRTSAERPVFDGTRDRGFGLVLMEAAVDRVMYGRLFAGKACLWLVKKLAPQAGAPGRHEPH